MAHAAPTSLARQLGTLFEGGSAAGLSDRQLLERFTAIGEPADEAAFSAIVARHGPMVLGVCRQLLGDHHDAEDAFQATFLVLARRARSIRDPDRLAFWLYGVALRTARTARRRLGRTRRIEERGAADRPEARPAMPAEQAIDREHAEALHREIERLPEPFRLAVVSCYLEGLSPDEAAERLHWSGGTLRSRLARAREKLRAGLARRGIVVSGAALAAMLEPRSAWASVPPLLCDSTTRAAIHFAAGPAAGAGVTAPAAALAREVLTSMLFHKVKTIAMTTMALAAVAAGAGFLSRSLAMKDDEPGRGPAPDAVKAAPTPTPAGGEPVPAAPGRMTVVGRVLDPDGKPIRNAVVDVLTRFRSPAVGAVDDARPWLTLLGQARSDGDGRFLLDAPRTAADRVFVVDAIAAAPGYGLGWARLDPDAEHPAAEIRLRPEQALRLRLVDVNGAPARGVEVHLMSVGTRADGGAFEGVRMSGPAPAGVRAWPRPIRTDDQGRAVLAGVGRGLDISLDVRDPRYARQEPRVDAAGSPPDREITVALEPAKTIEGRVLDAETGRPIPGAVVAIGAGRTRRGGMRITRFRADDQGRFTANPTAGEYFHASAYAPDDQPYLVPEVEFAWPKGAVRKELDIRVPRGVAIRGTVTDAATGRPLPGSSIQFMAVEGRPGTGMVPGSRSVVASRDDGSFRIAVPPGKGHLLIFGPTGDFILDEIGSNRLSHDRPGGRRFRAHAIIPYEARAGDAPGPIVAALRPGATIRGRVEGPDGQAVTVASLITTLRVDTNNPPMWRGNQQVPVRDGRFVLHGVDPGKPARISILDPAHEWGLTTDLAAGRAGEDLVLRLHPCGRAKGRFVGPDGRPLEKPNVLFEFVATPGRGNFSRRKEDRAELTADADFLANVDRKHYGVDPRPDAEGRFTMVALIPGALYRISDFSTANVAEKGAQIRKEFTARPGETIDLGDILIEKP